MDIKWKVQVLDKMFDDTYVRNLYLKMKYNTLGRFSFDMRDFGTVEVESYFAVGNTIRIFWGDILKMEGVIQKLVKSTTSWGWSIYGCDLNGLLLDRTPNMPYELGCDSLTIANSVMYAGCDFPTSMWGVGDGEEQGTYVLRYKVGLNTAYKQIRNLPHDLTWQTSTGGEGGIVSSVTSTSIVDDTKNWIVDQWKGAHCRMVTGAMKNNVYEVLSNTANSLNIGGGIPSDYFEVGRAGPIAVDGDRVYVGDAANGQVQVYDIEGNHITTWGSQGLNAPNIYTISCIAVSGGYVYIGVGSVNKVMKFTTSGTYVKEFAKGGMYLPDGTTYVWGCSSPVGIAVTGGLLYLDNADGGVVNVFNLDGVIQAQVCSGMGTGTAGIATDGAYLYTCGYISGLIKKWTLSGSLVSTWGGQGLPAEGEFNGAKYVTVDNGFVYVYSEFSGGMYSIAKFTTEGVLVEAIGVDHYTDNTSTINHSSGMFAYGGALFNACPDVSHSPDNINIGQHVDVYGVSDVESHSGIVPGDLYELTKGQTITWTKKYRVTNVKMTKNTHVISYNHTKDASKTHNSISVSGRDDNGGQIYTSLDDSSPITTLLSQESILSAPISASDTTIPVHDTTGFASSGEAWIE